MNYLKLEHVLRIHERISASSGGDPRIRDINAVESAIAQPRMTFDGQALYPTLAEKAAALGFSLNKNHAFIDGNKRTTHAAVEMFLLRNGWELDASVDEQEGVILGVASGAITRSQFFQWLQSRMSRRRS